MFSNPYRNVLIKSLSDILKPENNIKSSTLLQAFATFNAIKEIDSGDFFSTYKTLFTQKPTCHFLSRFSHENCKWNSDTFTETIDLFTSLSPSEFFRFIIPDIVSNPIKATTILHDKFSDNILLFAHHIIQVNRVTYSTKESSPESHEDVLDRLYYTYTNVELFAEIRLTKADFLELYGALYLHPLDPDELKIRLMKSERKKLTSAMDILANQLELPREEQVDIMCRFYVENEQPMEHLYSAKDYKIFEEIACSEIGFVDVEDITPEFCEFLFPIYFPEDSREDLLHKLTILSVALDKAKLPFIIIIFIISFVTIIKVIK